jgi:hypothetical protein
MGFCSLQHTGSEVHLTRALPAHYVPPSGFGHPLDGFLPSIPCRFFFRTGGTHGIHPSELPPPERYPNVSIRKNPLTVSPAGIPRAKHRAGSAGRGSWVSALPGVPGDTRVVSAPAAGCSLGFFPSRARHEDLGRDFARPPPARFGVCPAPRSLDQPPLRPICSRSKPRNEINPPFEGFRTRPIPFIRTPLHPSYEFASRSSAHCCASPTLFG